MIKYIHIMANVIEMAIVYYTGDGAHSHEDTDDVHILTAQIEDFTRCLVDTPGF